MRLLKSTLHSELGVGEQPTQQTPACAGLLLRIHASRALGCCASWASKPCCLTLLLGAASDLC